MASRYDLRAIRGDSVAWLFRLWQDEERTQPFDLAGCAVEAEVRKESGGPVLTTLTTTVTLPNEVRAEPDGPLEPGAWDLQITTAGGSVRTVLAGAVYVTPDITDSA